MSHDYKQRACFDHVPDLIFGIINSENYGSRVDQDYSTFITEFIESG